MAIIELKNNTKINPAASKVMLQILRTLFLFSLIEKLMVPWKNYPKRMLIQEWDLSDLQWCFKENNPTTILIYFNL